MRKIVVLLFLAIIFSACSSSSKISKNTSHSFKPLYHYTPSKNWVNDPNGMVYLDGEYHLFYQYNPFGDKWGHMSWGHAVSENLKDWEELPIAIPEIINTDSSSIMVFSGSVVIDSLNSSGFFDKGIKHGMVAVYTSHIDKKGQGLAQHQSLAYSSDKGRTWKFFDKNPVLDIGLKDFRDPNVFLHEGKWKMIVAKPLDFMVQIYESSNLKDWVLLSEFGKMGDVSKIWECPSLFRVPIQNSNKFKWVMLISSAGEDTNFTGMQYFVGEFDGKTFTPDKQEGVLRVNYGKDFYAAIPFNNLPEKEKNPIIMAWGNNWTYAPDIPSEGRRGMFSMPRKVSLFEENGKFRLLQKPIYANNIPTKLLKLNVNDLEKTMAFDMPTNTYRLSLDIDLAKVNGFTMDLLKNGEDKSVISYDLTTHVLSFDRTKSGNVDFNPKFASIERMTVIPQNNTIKLDVFVDNSMVEVFVNDGQATLTDLVFPHSKNGKIVISSLK